MTPLAGTDDPIARLSAIVHTPDEVAARAGRIYSTILEGSSYILAGNFEVIGVEDLRRLFDEYDREFFDGLLSRMLMDAGAGEVTLRLSSRMTSSGGTTTALIPKPGHGHDPSARPSYEIAVSTLLLFESFRHPGREVTVGGLVCRDRLEALQRIFEHELLHLAEFLATGRSSCAQSYFRTLSRRIFAHEASTHGLMTPRELAVVHHGIHVGDHVRFEHEGVVRLGIVNRITRRATVLVEDPAGRVFTDGKRYATFYVPVEWLVKQ